MIIEQHDEVNVIAVLHVLWQYRYFVGAVALLCGLLTVYVALTTTHVYSAEVVLTDVSTDGMGNAGSLTGRLGGLASLAGVNLSNSGPSREAHAILRSRYLAEEFIKRNDLAGELLGGAKKQSLWFAVDLFRRTALQIRNEKDSGTTVVQIKWSDPNKVAQWVNGYVALANEVLRARALSESTRNIKYLNEQIAKTNVVDLQHVLYSLVESETKTHMLANVREEYAFTVVDPAVVPETRIWPRRTLMVLTGGSFGVLLGGLLALAYNFWRRHKSALIGAQSSSRK